MKVFLSLVIGVAVLAGISAFAAVTEQPKPKVCVDAGKDKNVPCDPTKQSCPKPVDSTDGTAPTVQ